MITLLHGYLVTEDGTSKFSITHPTTITSVIRFNDNECMIEQEKAMNNILIKFGDIKHKHLLLASNSPLVFVMFCRYIESLKPRDDMEFFMKYVDSFGIVHDIPLRYCIATASCIVEEDLPEEFCENEGIFPKHFWNNWNA